MPRRLGGRESQPFAKRTSANAEKLKLPVAISEPLDAFAEQERLGLGETNAESAPS